MFAPVVLMKAFKAGGGAENPSGGVMFVYSILAVLAFCGLVSAALFNRETLGKALAVRTKDIDLEEDEPLIQSMGAQTVHFVQEQGKQIEKAAREGSENLQSNFQIVASSMPGSTVVTPTNS
mmetsp:Transcript_7315/g.10755  ORF Transcript_7315/g.10755 Transcript_7315/m.10755 type:complete len:122 (+) Transcript_7315:153-518(+)